MRRPPTAPTPPTSSPASAGSWVSLRAYARARGQSPSVIKAALDGGRLGSAATFDSATKQWRIDAATADRNWTANTKPLANRQERSSAPVPPRTPPPSPAPHIDLDDDDQAATAAKYFRARALREEAAARTEAAKAETAELDLAKRRGELVDTVEARAAVIDAFTRCKTHLLGVPNKFRRRCPDIPAADIRILADLVREALEQLAAADMDAIPEIAQA